MSVLGPRAPSEVETTYYKYPVTTAPPLNVTRQLMILIHFLAKWSQQMGAIVPVSCL